MTNDEAWRLEAGFWTGDIQHYAEALDASAVMAFPAPVGVLAGRAIIDSLKGAPRWLAIDMTECVVGHPGADLMVLGYRAEGRREGQTYRAYCTSTYRRDGDAWKLAQHQQTPIG
jgi:hypothetical protein